MSSDDEQPPIGRERYQRHAKECGDVQPASTSSQETIVFYYDHEKGDYVKGNKSMPPTPPHHKLDAKLAKLKPIEIDQSVCVFDEPTEGADWIEKLAFLFTDDMAMKQEKRRLFVLEEVIKDARHGFYMKNLHALGVCLDFFAMNVHIYLKNKTYMRCYEALLESVGRPIILTSTFDPQTFKAAMISHFNIITLLLIAIQAEHRFNILMSSVTQLLTVPDSQRDKQRLSLHHCREFALESGLVITCGRMIAMSSNTRFVAWINLTRLIATMSPNSCLKLMKENVIENLFHRFNPFYPDKALPEWLSIPRYLSDPNLKLGAATITMQTTLSLLLILIKCSIFWKKVHPRRVFKLKPIEDNALRGFIWAFWYECRAVQHDRERVAMVDILSGLFELYGSRLTRFGSKLMPDIISLAVSTEIPVREEWMKEVKFKSTQADLEFKISLITCCTRFLTIHPEYAFLIHTKHWIVGLMCLIDNKFATLKMQTSSGHNSELRKIATEALICTIPFTSPDHLRQCGIVKRTLFYLAIIMEDCLDMNAVYWKIRLLISCLGEKGSVLRNQTLKELIENHGIFVLIGIVTRIIENKNVRDWQKQQVIITRILTMLTAAGLLQDLYISTDICLEWPKHAIELAITLLNAVRSYSGIGCHISKRLLIALGYLIWEVIILNEERRRTFLKREGVFLILDILSSTTDESVQCVLLGLLLDVFLDGAALGQALTWRRRNNGILSLLIAIFRNGCKRDDAKIDIINGFVLDDERPLMPDEIESDFLAFSDYVYEKTLTECVTVSHMMGKTAPKVFAILQLLSNELKKLVDVVDQTYRLCQNIELSVEEELLLILISHYMVFKQGEAWYEVERGLQAASVREVEFDRGCLVSLRDMYRGWMRQIKSEQDKVVKNKAKKEMSSESSLYSFLSRVRLSTALDGLKEIRCLAPSSSVRNLRTDQVTRALSAHIKSVVASTSLDRDAPVGVMRVPMQNMDSINTIGHHVKVESNKHKGAATKAVPAKVVTSKATGIVPDHSNSHDTTLMDFIH